MEIALITPVNKKLSMKSSIQLKVFGDYACFTRPEMKVERVSYDVMTPSAARGILEAIYWKPQIRWIIKSITVLKPIQFTNIRRNELSEKIPITKVKSAMKANSEESFSYPHLDINQHRQQRASLILKDVAYAIKASLHILDCHLKKDGPKIPLNECAGKHLAMFKRRANKGQVFHQPYLGCREFPAHFELLDSDTSLEADLSFKGITQDLGYMLHDIEFDQDPNTKMVNDTTAHFFRAELRNGTITMPEKLPFSI